MFSSSTGLSRSGRISLASIRSSDRYNNFNASYSIKMRECELSRAALDRTFERTMNRSLGISKTPHFPKHSYHMEPLSLQKTRRSSVFSRPTESITPQHSEAELESEPNEDHKMIVPGKTNIKTSTEDISFEIRPSLSDSSINSQHSNREIMAELHPSDLAMTSDYDDEEEDVFPAELPHKSAPLDSDSEPHTRFSHALQGVGRTLKSLSSSLKISSGQSSELKDEEDFAHSVSGELEALELGSEDYEEDEDEIPKPFVADE